MIQRKDVKSLIMWSSGGAVLADLTLKMTLKYLEEKDTEQVSESHIFMIGLVSTFLGAVAGAFLGARNGASMKNKYEQNDLQNSISKITAFIGSTIGMINAFTCAIIGQNILHKKFIDVFTDENNNEFTDKFDLMDFAIKSTFNVIVLTICGYYIGNSYSAEVGLELEPISIDLLAQEGIFGLETLEKSNKICLRKALEEIKNAKGDVFKTLEEYNKVYKRRFRTLGTPVEMAKILGNTELAKNLKNKNNELILDRIYNIKYKQ